MNISLPGYLKEILINEKNNLKHNDNLCLDLIYENINYYIELYPNPLGIPVDVT